MAKKRKKKGLVRVVSKWVWSEWGEVEGWAGWSLVLSIRANGPLAQKISVRVRLPHEWYRWKAVPFLRLFQFIHVAVPGRLRLAPAKGLKHLSLAQASMGDDKDDLNWQKCAFGGCGWCHAKWWLMDDMWAVKRGNKGCKLASWRKVFSVDGIGWKKLQWTLNVYRYLVSKFKKNMGLGVYEKSRFAALEIWEMWIGKSVHWLHKYLWKKKLVACRWHLSCQEEVQSGKWRWLAQGLPYE